MFPIRPFVWSLAVFWLAASSLSAVEKAGTSVPRIAAELAPEELAAIVAKDALIATGDKGRELFVYLPELAVVQRYTEKGQSWGDPVPLRLEALEHPITLIRMSFSDGYIAFSGHTGAAVFSARDGSLRSQQRIFQPSDVAALPRGDFALALTNVPNPVHKGTFLARRSFGDEVPRVVIYDDDGDIVARGLIENEMEHPLPATARSLRLTWGDNALWAGELGSYRIIKLAPDLELEDQLHDSELDFTLPAAEEATVEVEQDSDTAAAEPAGSDPKLPTPGRDLAKRPESRALTRISARLDRPVMVDLDWGLNPGQLYWLLDRRAFKGIYQMDVFDPGTNEVRRTAFTLPEGLDGTLTQVAVGARYVWLRGYTEGSPLFRLDRSLLNEGAVQDVALNSEEPGTPGSAGSESAAPEN